MSRVLIVAGVVIFGIGLAMQLGVPLGRLPGDIVIRRGNATFYIPVVTCLVLSVIFSIVATLVRR